MALKKVLAGATAFLIMSAPFTMNETANSLIMSEITANAVAEGEMSGTCGENTSWVIDENGVLTVSGTGEIAEKAFLEYKTIITKAIIKSGITGIGMYSFANCEKMTSVEIADTVTQIGDFAFYQCGLTEAVIPKSVTLLGSDVFLLIKI